MLNFYKTQKFTSTFKGFRFKHNNVITRLGNNCRIILCGDYYQSDFTKTGDREGLEKFTKILENMKLFDHVEFTWEDIVRSGLVRDFIMTRELVENGKL